jgi:hypothetical protein
MLTEPWKSRNPRPGISISLSLSKSELSQDETHPHNPTPTRGQPNIAMPRPPLRNTAPVAIGSPQKDSVPVLQTQKTTWMKVQLQPKGRTRLLAPASSRA